MAASERGEEIKLRDPAALALPLTELALLGFDYSGALGPRRGQHDGSLLS